MYLLNRPPGSHLREDDLGAESTAGSSGLESQEHLQDCCTTCTFIVARLTTCTYYYSFFVVPTYFTLLSLSLSLSLPPPPPLPPLPPSPPITYIVGVSSYVMNDRMFPILTHPTHGDDTLGLCCPVCEGRHSREKSPTRYIRSLDNNVNCSLHHIHVYIR